MPWKIDPHLSEVRSRRLGCRQVKGTGIGLAIVQLIAAGHGGEVRVASEVDAGSTFTLVLPAQVT